MDKFLVGDRVDVPLKTDSEISEKDLRQQKNSANKPGVSGWLMKDIVEKDQVDADLSKNLLCIPKNAEGGFPVPKKLSWKPLVAQYEYSNKKLEKESLLSDEISEENMRSISKMSPEEIKNAKEELMKSLNPELVQKLMQKKRSDNDVDNVTNKQRKSVHFSCPDKCSLNTSSILSNQKEQKSFLPTDMHFPAPPSFGDLDPSSPDFLKHLHSKYFPDLPVDPSKLAWMTPPTMAEDEMEYHESMSEIAPESIRFDFNGDILSPRISRQIPMYIGLHHHADAPLAAGYSIPELAHLSRSTFPAQRCIAILILGRILYKLSMYTYGPVVTSALKKVVENLNVIDSLVEAACEKTTRHLSVKVYAEEALYLAHCKQNESM
ncbi:uncharacterized protein T551_01592 [Pneumocystis jirovecii RU7]|uniref:RNA polymerase II-associated protein 1 N-terminal domain-containing protein n=1 Tax=Pneumocystis jirovecii (strain RU7) TaxID=1408657 RepID=A0A0W4ZRP3_PNEJ7|nr:uncharacterized protein T551_01592 [Pneumocystis jirovecii RU7]KTW31040.1 hypothetical protein T551_01592 [Pneumocystis jirovecii RU7]